MLIKIILILLIFDKSNCFNLDVDYPVIYEDPTQNKLNNLFGFSIILNLWNLDESSNAWIKIGAPKFLDGNKTSTGLVYKYDIINNKTNTILSSYGKGFVPNSWGYYYDRYTMQSLVPEVYHQNIIQKSDKVFKSENLSLTPVRKSNAFFGGVMDIDVNSGKSVICSPHFIKQFNKKNYLIGACYSEFDTSNNLNPYYSLAGDLNVFKDENKAFIYEFSEFGFSLHISPKTKDILIGAPGLNNWKGQIVLYKSSNTEFTNIPYSKSRLSSFDYFGYSISSGYFFTKDKIFYVGGAPRSDYIGKVIIFESISNSTRIKQTISGTTLGEYFGTSLAVLDINGDGFHDLVVGAPHYYKRYDEGRVYVYLSKYKKNEGRRLEAPDQGAILEGTIPGGQFGLAIKSLGDLNHDGYDDIVVGAPYEDDRHGVIYIYNGGPHGLNSTASQIISGKSIHNALKGFGLSFSNAADIDGNNYNDVAVGAPISGHVVLLRSRPVVELNLELKTYDSYLSPNTTEFKIKACYQFSNGSNEIEIKSIISPDVDYKRIRIPNNGNWTYEFSKRLHLNSTYKFQQYCEDIQLYKENNSLLLPIKILLTAELIEQNGRDITIIRGNGTDIEDKFCKNCPVMHQRMKTREATVEIPFDLNCGADHFCSPDLKVTGHFNELRNNKFIIQSQSSLTLEINVENNGEPAYNTQIKLKLPKNIYLQSISPVCDEVRRNVICRIDNPLQSGIKKSIRLLLGMDQIIEKTQVEFNITATSQGDDTNLDDNKYLLKLDFEVEADIKINGNADKSSMSIGNSTVLEFVHTYEVQKTGASPLEETELEVLVPIKFHKNDINFLIVDEVETSQDSQRFVCTSKDFQIDSIKKTKEHTNNTTQNPDDTKDYEHKLTTETPVDDVESDYFIDGNNNEYVEIKDSDDTNDETSIRSKRSILTTDNVIQLELPPNNRTLFLNCSDSNINCTKITCELRPFKKSDGNAKLSLSIRINISLIEPHLGLRDIIYLTTHGSIRELKGPRKDNATVSTLILGSLKEQSVELWIIIVSVIGGILLLILIIAVLIKIGFFKRTGKEKLLKLKEAKVSDDFFPYVRSNENKGMQMGLNDESGGNIIII